MKKITLLSLLLLIAIAPMQAQYWLADFPAPGQNPNGLNTDNEYPVGGGIPSGWATLLAPTATPTWSATTALPFAFNFNGSPVTSFKVSNSATLTFDVATAVTAPSFTAVAIPSATVPDKSICILGIKGTGTNDNIVTKTFGASPNRQFWVSFSSYSDATTNEYFYYSIVLEETTNKIYVVDQRTNGTAVTTVGVQIDATNAISVAGSPALDALAGSSFSPSDNAYYAFTPGTQPAFDMAANDITTAKYLAAGNATITGVVRNMGATTITSFDINYSLDGAALQTSAISGVSIPALATYNFTHSIPAPFTSGTHLVDIYCSNLNGGNPDVDGSNDHKMESFYVMSSNEVRYPLFEVFTSSTCPPCNPGNVNYHSIVDTRPKSEYVSVKFQQDFPGTGDPYTTAEAVSRRGYYLINSIPRMEINGGWDGNAGSFTNSLYDDSRAQLPQYKMNGDYAVDVAAKTVTAKIKYSPLIDITGTKLHVAILEKTTVNNVKSNGEVEFYSVMKKMVPDQNGTAIGGTVGAWDSLSFSYVFNGSYRLPTDGTTANVINHATEHSVEHFDSLYVIAWIQGSDKVIYQAANLSTLSTTAIGNFSNVIQNVSIYPNPTADFFTIDLNMENKDNVMATLISEDGSVIEAKSVEMNVGKNSIEFNTSGLAAGVYNVILLDSKKNAAVHQIVVVH
jgi:hypothetical protein